MRRLPLDRGWLLKVNIFPLTRQEESRSLSENVTWGQRKRLADGKVRLPYGRFLGYEKGEDGLPKIVEREAKVIRLIYKFFLEGKTHRVLQITLRRGASQHRVENRNGNPRQFKASLPTRSLRAMPYFKKLFPWTSLLKRGKLTREKFPSTTLRIAMRQ